MHIKKTMNIKYCFKLVFNKNIFLGLGIAVLVISISFRLVVSYLAVLGGDLNIKERIFISMAWLPKGWYFMFSTKKHIFFSIVFRWFTMKKRFLIVTYWFWQFLRAGRLLLPFRDTVSTQKNWENKKQTLWKPLNEYVTNLGNYSNRMSMSSFNYQWNWIEKFLDMKYSFYSFSYCSSCTGSCGSRQLIQLGFGSKQWSLQVEKRTWP